jgi:hypothetical protein
MPKEGGAHLGFARLTKFATIAVVAAGLQDDCERCEGYPDGI